MRLKSGSVVLAPSDLSNFLSCRHLAALDLRAARGEAERPKRTNAMLDELRARGIAHERAYLEDLRGRGLTIAAKPAPPPGEPAAALDAAETFAAMREGVDVIYQATLADEAWSGCADFLTKVATPSGLGDWSYEVVDTKLARETRAGTILQLCVYTRLVEKLQGLRPERMYVVSPGNAFAPLPYRTDEYAAYFRLLERGIGGFVGRPAETYPEMVAHCDLCAWWQECEQRRRADDALCYVAGISTSQIRSLRELGIDRLADLARLGEVPEKPAHGSREALVRVRDQARIQWRGREQRARLHELRAPLGAGHGLAMLPGPTPDDIFLDFEGNHFAEHGVQEYLTGYVTSGPGGRLLYKSLWARTAAEERGAFEQFMDVATATRARNPTAHVYHFAAYEPAALKRLMGRYATREVELDALLRGKAFVDLHTVLRRALIASVERYSIKDMEPFFGYARQQELREAAASRRLVEQAIEAGEWDEAAEGHRAIVEAYNREDCESAQRLRDWLERLRAGAIAAGHELPRPDPRAGEAPEKISELDQELGRLRDGLLADVPADPAARDAGQQARFVLAHLMEFHRREDKASWWEYYRLLNVDVADYAEERRAIAGLQFERVLEACPAPLQRYRFPPQDLDARADEDVYDPDGRKIGKVDAVDHGARTIDIKKTKATANAHPPDAILHNQVPAEVLRKSLMRFGEAVLGRGFAGEAPYRAAEALLLRRSPVQPGERALERAGEPTVDAACRIALRLDGQVLAIQGPPGTGKTYTGAQIICALKSRGLKVGVTAVSHKVIVKLLEGAMEEAGRQGLALRAAHKHKKQYAGRSGIETVKDHPPLQRGLADGSFDVVGATVWTWARPEFEQSLDVLIVDEAGQMALGNVLAAAPAARSLVLLGDPQQLEQPLQSSHPEGSEVSALYHWLDGADTMPPERGLFLGRTWRLHPDIARFTSEVYYESRLEAKPGLDRQAILTAPGKALKFAGSGLRFLPVPHAGNQARSHEEVAAIAALVGEFLAGGLFRNAEDKVRALSADDILIVAPYNAQVAALVEGVPALAGRIGTVDRFQGQEAPVVIYSMTSSSPDDAPRGMEFLYNAHRFNVATSRAKALCILVGNPALFEPDCRTPRQMKMANGFCRFLELTQH